MFIDFEGIDGSGKTTLSNRLAERLRDLGYPVVHAREKGELQSALARSVRELTRDARHLEMGARTEFFLNLARDAQQQEAVIAPALARGGVVIADRYLYSQLALTGGGRGLSAEQLDAACELAADGVWPDLVVLVDVDPDLARWRKRLGKLVAGRPSLAPGSRKGLSGVGLNVRVRQHFLEQARRDPERWLILPNESDSLDTLEERLVQRVLAVFEARGMTPGAAAPSAERAPTPGRNTLRVPPLTQRPPASPAQGATAGLTPDRALEAFEARLGPLFDREPGLALGLLTGFGNAAAFRLRSLALDHNPVHVALSLAGLTCDLSWELRAHLAPRAPDAVVRSLLGTPLPDRLPLLEQLCEQVPGPVAAALSLDPSPLAWRLREQARQAGQLDHVLLGLGGLSCPRSWALREEGLRRGLAAAVARSLQDLNGPRAEALREQLMAEVPLAVLRGTRGMDSPVAEGLRASLLLRAPKLVLRSLTGLTDASSWAMREQMAPITKEALDSVDGLGGERAWALREAHQDRWPATVASSMRGLPLDRRAEALLRRILARHGERLVVLRNAALTWKVARRDTRLQSERPLETSSLAQTPQA